MTEDGEDRDALLPVGARREAVHRFTGRVHEVLDELTAGGVPVVGLSGAAGCGSPGCASEPPEVAVSAPAQ